jgi:hypothetical protein
MAVRGIIEILLTVMDIHQFIMAAMVIWVIIGILAAGIGISLAIMSTATKDMDVSLEGIILTDTNTSTGVITEEVIEAIVDGKDSRCTQSTKPFLCQYY